MAYGFNEDKTKASIEDIAEAAGANKVDKVTGKGLSTNNFTDADKAIVAGATAQLANKVDKVTGKGLSTNDLTTAYKTKIEEASYNTFAPESQLVQLSRNGYNSYSASNPFICPHDGYISTWVYDENGYAEANIKVSSSININHRINANSGYPSALIPVKKGMKIFAVTSGEDNFVNYYPLTSYT